MDIVIVSAVCILLAFALLSLPRIRGKSSQNNPPGPCPLPIIGNIHKLGKHPHKSLASLAQVNGPIMRLKLGRITTIVISSSSTAQQVLQKQDLEFSSRSQTDAVHALCHNKYSVVFLPVGSRWRSLRKIMSSYIFAANKLDKNQHLRSRKVHDLIRYCEKCCQSGEAVDIGSAAFLTSLNLLSNTIFSKDMINSYENSEAKEFRDLVWNILFEAGKPNLVDYFPIPILRWIDPQGIRRKMTSYFEKLTKSFDGLIKERLELRRVGNAESSTSTIDVLEELLKMLQTDEIEETQIHNLFIDLFVAGTDTTSNTVEWAMSEILRNSEILVKVKAELNQVIGKGKIIQEADISKLVYLQCIVKESMRLHPPVPFLIPRQVEREVQLCGYTVPKNSQVLVNAWAIGRDPKLWINPLSFQPERFMDSQVDINGHYYELIPFGAGRRICPGMSLAMRMVPVMVGSLINCFDWKLEGGILPEKLDMEEKFGITLAKLHPLRAVATLVVL
ncbi:Geraniol 8-hydroxylase [Heracleum sosnowskyi]|uniref:Geraniol 8-hydroxylase n=1 Tax=Heracleum sosnowskyi TaxID=360622 RepID=A0AAD8M1X5_9APIA|nr:Geraniol 8-hydroxylase [Heracleum sosnowskyi]